ncbi:MAG: hypothetical protein KDI42_09285 [Gammaproteobacteria bacterium]|nr:hypothetical protein [Gammaproteobacteria bacterium]
MSSLGGLLLCLGLVLGGCTDNTRPAGPPAPVEDHSIVKNNEPARAVRSAADVVPLQPPRAEPSARVAEPTPVQTQVVQAPVQAPVQPRSAPASDPTQWPPPPMVEPRPATQKRSGPLPGDPGYRHERVEIGSALKLKPQTPAESAPASTSGPRELPPVALVTPEPIREPIREPKANPVPVPQASVSAEPTQDKPPAVAALLADANRQMRAGNNDAAAAALERALRVQPRDAYLWHRLAYVRLEQGRGSDAESLALKSNSLAGDKLELVETNNRLIERARRLGGSAAGGR